MAQGNPSGSDNNGSGGQQPSADSRVIADAIDAAYKKYEAAQSDQADHNSNTLFWARIAGVGVGIYTLITLGIAVIALCQLRTVRDTEQRQLRAYVGIFDHQVKSFVVNQKPIVSIAIKNFGLTPARNVRYWLNTKFDRIDKPELPSKSYDAGSVVLFPADGTTPTLSVNAFDDAAMAIFNGGTQVLFIYGALGYVDAFEQVRCTNFRLQYGIENVRIASGHASWAVDGNEIDRNCIDPRNQQ